MGATITRSFASALRSWRRILPRGGVLNVACVSTRRPFARNIGHSVQALALWDATICSSFPVKGRFSFLVRWSPHWHCSPMNRASCIVAAAADVWMRVPVARSVPMAAPSMHRDACRVCSLNTVANSCPSGWLRLKATACTAAINASWCVRTTPWLNQPPSTTLLRATTYFRSRLLPLRQ